MRNFEHVQGLLTGEIASKQELLYTLSTVTFSVEQVQEIIGQVRELRHLNDLLTAMLLGQLQDARAYTPTSRASFNKVMHEGRFSRKELKALTRLSHELFDAHPSVQHADGIPARLPNTATGMATAAFGADSAMVIAKPLDAVPIGTPPETCEWVEVTMATMAHALPRMICSAPVRRSSRD